MDIQIQGSTQIFNTFYVQTTITSLTVNEVRPDEHEKISHWIHSDNITECVESAVWIGSKNEYMLWGNFHICLCLVYTHILNNQ